MINASDMPIKFEFSADEDTKRLFEIAVYFLERYFGYGQDEAVKLVNYYYNQRENKHDDDYYHHEGAFHVAVQIHYFIYLEKDIDHFPEWKLDHNLINTPREAIDYFHEHYYVR